MKLKVLAALGFILIFTASPIQALERFTLYMVQSTLKEHGYTLNEPDGLMGPATREALSRFSKAYGAPSDPDGAFKFMINLSVAARRPIIDEAVLEKIKIGVAEQLRDPLSVMIRNVYRVTDGDNEKVCGEVNGKNAYGGYAGYTPFSGMMLMGHFAILQVDGPDSPIAELRCLLSFPIKR